MKRLGIMLILVMVGRYVCAEKFSDMYLENRSQSSIKVDLGDEGAKNVSKNSRQFITFFPLPDKMINRNVPDKIVSLYNENDDFIAKIELFGSGLGGGAGAGVLIDDLQHFTERDSAVAGISSVDMNKAGFHITAQVYPFGGKSDVNIIVE